MYGGYVELGLSLPKLKMVARYLELYTCPLDYHIVALILKNKK